MEAVKAVFVDRKSIIRGGNEDALCFGTAENDISMYNIQMEED